MAGQAWKRGTLAVLFLASLLAGGFLSLSPAWERRGEEEKKAALFAQVQEAVQETSGRLCGRGDHLTREPMEELAQGPAGKQAEKTIQEQGQWEKKENGAGQEIFLERGKQAAQERPQIQEAEPEGAGEPGEGADPEKTADPDGIGILTIPKIQARLPVTAGVSKEQLKVSEGWVRQSSPIGGMGNAVVAGHRSYTYGRHFNRLGELEAGDAIFFTSIDGGEMCFAVSEVVVTEPEDPAVFAQPPEGTAWLTLYTCTPVRIASHRLIVRAQRVE